MKLKILLSIVISITLSACGTSGPKVKAELARGSLVGTKDLSAQLLDQPAKSGAYFNTNGFTIIGVAYVAAAVAKMKSQSVELNTSFDQYLKDHPNELSLKDTFNKTLESELAKRGVKLTQVNVKRVPNHSKRTVSYELAPGEAKTPNVLITDALVAEYFAPSSTEDYVPKSVVGVTVMTTNSPASALPKQEMFFEYGTNGDSKYSFSNYEALNKDVSVAYKGLQLSVERIAQKTAAALFDGQTK